VGCASNLFVAIRTLLDRRSLLFSVRSLLHGRALINTRCALLYRRSLTVAIRGGLHWRPYAWTDTGLNVHILGPDDSVIRTVQTPK
jgi:hypothetical protein